MPSQPTPGQVHIERYLTDIAIRYAQDTQNFIADKVFPPVPVQKASDLYVKFDKSYFWRDEVGIRPLNGRPRKAGWEIEHGNYTCVEYGLEYPIDDRLRVNADQPIEPDLRGTEYLTEQMLIHRDREWVESYFKAGIWSTEYAGVTGTEPTSSQFTKFDKTGSKPVIFFDELSTKMLEKTGRRPNKLILGAELWPVLKNHTEVVERVKYTMGPPAVVSTDVLATLFQVDSVHVAGGVYNSAKEGKTESLSFILAPSDALLVYANPAPSITAPSAGYTFAWTGLIPGYSQAYGGVILRGREELAHTDIIQIRAAYDMVATATDLGIFLKEGL